MVGINGQLSDKEDTRKYVLMALSVKLNENGLQRIHSMRDLQFKTPNIYSGYSDINS